MKVKHLALGAALLSSIIVQAADRPIPQGVEVSTDPARVAEVERHARELQARQTMGSSGTSDAGKVTHHRSHKRVKARSAKAASAPQ